MTIEWKTSRLGGICQLIKRGIAPKYTESGGICVINQKCIRDHRVNRKLARRHDLAKKKVNPERLIKLGDVLVNSTGTGTLGRVAQVLEEFEEPTTVDTHVTIVRPLEGLFCRPFFGYMMVFIEEQIIAGGEGSSGQTELPRAKLENDFFVTYPDSLGEQQRIVAILDEAFAGIDTAIANTEKNLANAQELFESYLNSLFTQQCEEWPIEALISFVDSVSTGPFGSLLHKSDYVSSGFPLVNPINIIGEKIVPDEKKMIADNTKKRLQSYVLRENDIVIGRRGKIGRCAVVTEQQAGWVCGTGCFFIRPSSETNPHFLTHLLRSFHYRMELERLASGATMLNLSNKALANMQIALPSLSEQHRFLEQISGLKKQCLDVQFTYQQKLTALAELKQSLLQKAFSGELTAKAAEKELDEAVA